MPIQNADGSYAQGYVAEVEHDLNLGFSAPISGGLSAVGNLSSQTLLSNQVYVAAGVPSYKYYDFTLGLQWDWSGAH